MNNIKISIVVPAYNEEGNIKDLVLRTHKALKSTGIIYELVFIDDNSTDKTRVIIEKLATKYPIKVFSKIGKQGKAYCLIQGFKETKYNIVGMIDADLQYPPEAIPEMVKKLAKADIIASNRIDKSAPGFMRKITSWGFRFVFVRILFGLKCDSQSGLKVFKKEILDYVKLNPTRWTFDLEFLYKAKSLGYIIADHNIEFFERQSGEVKLKLLSSTFEIGVQALKLRLKSFYHIFFGVVYRPSRGYVNNKIVTFFIFFSLLTIFLGKSLFVQTDNVPLYLYGVTVTSVLIISFYYAFYRYKDPAVIAEKMEKRNIKIGFEPEKPFVSCMVAVYNEEAVIEQCILSLMMQTYKNKEIIFVNDGSTDGTAKVLDMYAKDGSIKVIHQKNAGKKRALGRAMREAKGSIFAFSDSDSVWAKDAVETIVRVFNMYPEVGGVSGHFRLKNALTNTITKAQDAWAEGQFAIRKAFESYFGVVSCISGPLAVFRREAIYNFIPAWEQDRFLGQEFKFATDRTLTGYLLGNKYIGKKIKAQYADEDCVKKINYPEKEWKVVYAKSAKSWTILPDNFKSLTKQHVRWKKSFIRNTFFTGSFYWRKPLIPALVYYLHVLFVLIGPFITLRHLIYLPLRGNLWSALLYVVGILFIGFMFGFAYKLENKNCHIWIYRPVMSLLSTLYLSFLIFYSAPTIKKMVWHRG